MNQRAWAWLLLSGMKYFLLFTVLYYGILICKSDEQHRVKLLVVGKTGTGKSTLINGIIGRDIADIGKDLDSKTTTVVHYHEKFLKEDVIAEVCDSPGFQDGKSKDDMYMEMLRTKCSNPDVVLFCISMTDMRWTEDQAKTIEKVTEALGADVWENTVLVLTFANILRDKDIDKKKQQFTQKFVQSLRAVKVKKEIINNIPTVLAGVADELHLHGARYWFSRLYLTCLQQAKPDGKVALVKINHARITNDANNRSNDPLSKQFIYLVEDLKNIFCKLMEYSKSKSTDVLHKLLLLSYSWNFTGISNTINYWCHWTNWLAVDSCCNSIWWSNWLLWYYNYC